jgi:hypothetical protein
MRKLVAAIAVVVSLTVMSVGIASAWGGTSQAPADPSRGRGMMTACAATHDTPAMERMHAAMPAELQAQCDAMHSETAGMMDGADMMSPGVMGGSPGTVPSGMDAHHSSGMMG